MIQTKRLFRFPYLAEITQIDFIYSIFYLNTKINFFVQTTIFLHKLQNFCINYDFILHAQAGN